MDIKGREYLTLKDLKSHSIWKCSRSDDLMYPVTSAEEFPEDSFDLSIRAIFTTPEGIEFLGYLVGIKNIYSIAIYVGDRIFCFNRNLPQDYPKKLDQLGEALDKNLSISNFSPLKYKTDIDLAGFRNIEGEFDLLRKMTNAERLEGL